MIHRLQIGGLENGLVNIINRLPRDQFRHAIICLTESSDFAKRIEPPVQIIELHKREGNDLRLYWRLYRTFMSLRPDVVHTRNLSALEAQIPAWLAGVKYRIHGLHGWDVHDLQGNNKRYQFLYRVIGRFVHQFVPLSNELESYLSQKVGVAAKKITNICNGVDTDKFAPSIDRAALRERLLPNIWQPKEGPMGCRPVSSRATSGETNESTQNVNGDKSSVARQSQNDKFIIGTVGRLELVKDQSNLVRAFIQLLQQHCELKQHVRLVLVGDGSQRPQIESMINEANLSNHIWLAGSRNDVPELLRIMDLFVLPSKAEGISNTVLEAMASGLPIIATDVGGNSQLLDNSQAGKLIPKENQQALMKTLKAFVMDSELVLETSLNARRAAEQKFSLAKMVHDYQRLYEQPTREVNS